MAPASLPCGTWDTGGSTACRIGGFRLPSAVSKGPPSRRQADSSMCIQSRVYIYIYICIHTYVYKYMYIYIYTYVERERDMITNGPSELRTVLGVAQVRRGQDLTIYYTILKYNIIIYIYICIYNMFIYIYIYTHTHIIYIYIHTYTIFGCQGASRADGRGRGHTVNVFNASSITNIITTILVLQTLSIMAASAVVVDSSYRPHTHPGACPCPHP